MPHLSAVGIHGLQAGEDVKIKNFVISAASVLVHMMISESLRDLIQRSEKPTKN